MSLRRRLETEKRPIKGGRFRQSMLLKERTGKGENGGPPKPPAMWNALPTEDLAPPAVWGQYPKGFIPWALSAMGCPGARNVLHVCSGALRHGHGTRVDLRATQRPDVCADAMALPFRNGVFDAVLADPPYSRDHAAELYGTRNLSVRRLISEALRVVRPSGPVGLLHFIVPFYDTTLADLERVYGVTTGSGYKIRAFSVLRRKQAGLWEPQR